MNATQVSTKGLTRRLLDSLDPTRAIRGTRWYEEWKKSEVSSTYSISKIALLASMIFYPIQIPLDYLGARHEVFNSLLLVRISMAGVGFLLYLLLKLPWIQRPGRIKIPLILAGITLSLLQAILTALEPMIPFYFVMLCAAVVAIILELSIILSLFYYLAITILLFLIAPPVGHAKIEMYSLLSVWLVLAILVTRKTRHNIEIFIRIQESLEIERAFATVQKKTLGTCPSSITRY